MPSSAGCATVTVGGLVPLTGALRPRRNDVDTFPHSRSWSLPDTRREAPPFVRQAAALPTVLSYTEARTLGA